MEEQEQPLTGFVHRLLPLLVAAAGLLLYLVTLNQWVTFASLPIVSRVLGGEWAPSLQSPLYQLVTLPFRLLPAGLVPIGLNFLSAVCAALTLGLLARSVALLPHDRTREQRQRERSEFSLLSLPYAWLPPVAAVLVCGLQFTFWEHAIAATGEMLNLLVFAYAIRCLLEYRVDPRERWLFQMAFVYGLGITNNWALIGFFPGFLIATIWICGMDFFRPVFVLKMMLFGVAGLLLYLLLPLLAVLQDPTTATFAEYLRTQLGAQKSVLLGYPKGRVLILSLTSILPVLVMGIRWPSSFGDLSIVGAMLTSLMFRIVHALFLAACLWVAFDPKFSPRSLGYGLPFLTFYYLGALSIGYFSGYFLLLFSSAARSSRSYHRPKVLEKPLNWLVTAIVVAGCLGAPAGLAYKNWPAIRALDGTTLKEYANWLTRSLPSSGIALSDDGYLSMLVRTARTKPGQTDALILLDSRTLQHPAYQRYLHRTYPDRWPDLVPKTDRLEAVPPGLITGTLSLLARSNQLHYLHPSFGYLFEELYPWPRGLTLELHTYATNAITPPALDEAAIAQNIEFWSLLEKQLENLAVRVQKKWDESVLLGSYLSRSANCWGVELQRLGRLEEAGRSFALAQRLNPDNIPAVVNAAYNQTLRTGQASSTSAAKIKEGMRDKYRTWDAVMIVNGPFDEPEFCYEVGQRMMEGRNLRQAAIHFSRVTAFDPNNFPARLMLASTYLQGQAFDEALQLAKDTRARLGPAAQQVSNQVELIRLESLAHLGKGETEIAERALLEAHRQFPQDNAVLDTLFYVYFSTLRFSNVLAVIDQQLALNPQNPRALLNKGATLIETKAFKEAVAPLDQVLRLQPDNQAALRNRAIALLQSGQLDRAEQDYLTLNRREPDSYIVQFGLGEIAFRRKDTKKALDHYEKFLKNAPSSTLEIEAVRQKVEALRPGKAAR
jgi:tetratricopeptide (TPR) repeat protein